MTTPRLVLDPGSCHIKAGSSAESLPSLVVPSVVGVPPKKKSLLKKASASEEASPSILFGADALAAATTSGVTLHAPITSGTVTDWAQMEQLLNYCFDELGMEPEATPVVLTLPLFTAKANVERFAATFFESFMVPELAFAPQGLCGLYAAGRTTGVVLESGEGITSVVPIYDSYIIEKAANRMNVGGADVTQHMRRLLFERGYSFSSFADSFQVRDIKESTSYVAQSYAEELAAAASEDDDARHTLPDGQEIAIGKERFRCTEILFAPAIVQSEQLSMGDFVTKCIKSCDVNISRDLSSNIVLSGGNTLMPGFGSRLRNDVAQRFPGMFGSVSVVEGADRRFNVWAGAAVLANLESMQDSLIRRDEYDEVGPSIVHGFSRAAASARRAQEEGEAA